MQNWWKIINHFHFEVLWNNWNFDITYFPYDAFVLRSAVEPSQNSCCIANEYLSNNIKKTISNYKQWNQTVYHITTSNKTKQNQTKTNFNNLKFCIKENPPQFSLHSTSYLRTSWIYGLRKAHTHSSQSTVFDPTIAQKRISDLTTIINETH